jgi:hypothetical protein
MNFINGDNYHTLWFSTNATSTVLNILLDPKFVGYQLALAITNNSPLTLAHCLSLLDQKLILKQMHQFS